MNAAKAALWAQARKLWETGALTLSPSGLHFDKEGDTFDVLGESREGLAAVPKGEVLTRGAPQSFSSVEITVTAKPATGLEWAMLLHGNALAFVCRGCGADQCTGRWDVPVGCSRCGTKHDFRGVR